MIKCSKICIFDVRYADCQPVMREDVDYTDKSRDPADDQDQHAVVAGSLQAPIPVLVKPVD